MKKMLVSDFFSSKEKIVVRCDSKEKALKIFNLYKTYYNKQTLFDEFMDFDNLLNFYFEHERNCITSNMKNIYSEKYCKCVGIKIIDYNDLIIWNEYYMLDHNKYYVNYKKKVITIVSPYGNKEIIKCDENDTFNIQIGLGLAISKFYGNKKEYKEMRELFRSKKTRKLDYKKYGLWCLLHYCNYDISNLEKKLNIIYQ